MSDNERSKAYPDDEFDRMLGMLDGLPGLIKTDCRTKRVVPNLGVGGVVTFNIQTLRLYDKEPRADGKDVTVTREYLFLETTSKDRHIRLVIPDEVCEIIARQRESLTTQKRSRIAKAQAAARKASGFKPNLSGLRKYRRKAKRA